ncbi:MAG: radical SAM protein [Clostridia bacterium]|nr:radical SAM protein [Clostridia bacterium]
MEACHLCPRHCGASRTPNALGVCGQTRQIRIARAALHPYEEPPISGNRGSGTVFFCGCSLRCVFCQNRAISRGEQIGEAVTPRELTDIFLRLEQEGAHNINLVTPTHFLDGVLQALELVKHRLTIPVLYNTSGYELVEALGRLEGLVDIYLPDFKYYSSKVSAKYSGAPDYREIAEKALLEMYRQVGTFTLDTDGLLRSGLLVRHLVLPGNRHDSMAVLSRLSELLPVTDLRLSLMSQYTPDFALECPHKELHRRVTRFEYESVLEHALSLGFTGYMQGRASASSLYTPNF